jgi:hypothetical protein
MLRLKNIQIKNDIAEADFIPENESECGHIVVDLKSKEIVSIKNVPGYEYMHPGHARAKLVEMAKAKDSRSECTVMWY